MSAPLGIVLYGSGLTADTDRMPSPFLWKDCPEDSLRTGACDGYVYWNDFLGDYSLAANQSATVLPDGVVGWTGATAGTLSMSASDDPTGVLRMLTTTDNEDTGIAILGGNNVVGQCIFTSNKKLWFETRLKFNNITDSKFGVFVGFAEEALASTAAVVAADGTMADKDYVGFHRLEADGDKMDLVYNTASGSTSPVTHLADAVTLVADTYIKLGIYCDGTEVYFYVNGIKVGSELLLAATDFPNGEEMAFYIAQQAAHADDAYTYVDWVKIAQQR
jgi:hypothetical protein